MGIVVLIVLIIVGVVAYFIYQYLPNTKFEKAQNLFNAKDYIQAVNILNEIFEEHVDAPAKIAECKLNLGQQSIGNTEKIKYFNEAIEIRKRISNSTSIEKFESIEAKALFEIAKIQYEETKGDIEKLIQNIQFIDTANKKSLESNFSSLKTKHFDDLADSHFKKGTEKEKSGKFAESIQIYNTTKDYAKKSGNITFQNNSDARIRICQLKQNENINLSNMTKIQKSDKNYQKELYYRYAIKLLKNKEFSEAEKIISSHLNFRSSNINKLIEVLNAEKNNSAVKKVAEINESIEKLYTNTLSAKELKILYDNLDKTSNEISAIDKELSERIFAIKPTLFNRLLNHYISAEQYGNAVIIILQFPRFWESPELLKNLGICCYGYASKGLLTERNYRIVISGWLTSVFSDRVILKSLEGTTWDDNYTFSLFEAVGSKYQQHEEIPDNVNYDEISESNISIGATQKELLQQFETIIQKKIQDVNLSKLVNDFYDKEKEAIEKIIDVIENDILFATPYFAQNYGLNKVIIEHLDNDYLNYSDENALEAGVPYIKDSTSSFVYQYFFANNIIDKVKSSIDGENLANIKKLNTLENKKWIEKFDNVSSSVEHKLFSSIANKITKDGENEKLILIMEECIAFSNQNEKLKHQYSDYVANYIISKVNDEKIDNFKALSLMKGAYLSSPNNPKVCKNLITLIRFNLMDVLNDRTIQTTEIYNILDWVKNNMSRTYEQKSNELSKVRREILAQLKKAGVDISPFNDSSISSIFSEHSLNSEGLKMKKVLTYLKELSSQEKSTNPLDEYIRLRRQINLDNDDLPF